MTFEIGFDAERDRFSTKGPTPHFAAWIVVRPCEGQLAKAWFKKGARAKTSTTTLKIAKNASRKQRKRGFDEMLNQYAQKPPPREPTGDECYAEKIVPEFGMYAAWYPQMGGYSAKCWIEARDGEDGCFDAWVYHDGRFPFDSKQVFDDEWGRPQVRQPAKIHHCSATQFIEFGRAVQSMLRKSE